jgi:hypothetical protein
LSSHDYDIANQTAANFRTDLNNALQAAASNNSGTTYPSTPYANMICYRTDTHKFFKRNEANTAWILLGTVDEANTTYDPNYTYATNADATTGTDNTKVATILRARQTVSVLVATLATTSGSTVTASGLDLSTFRELHVVLNAVSSTAVSYLTLNGLQITASLASAANVFRGTGVIDLNIGTFSFTSMNSSTTSPASFIALSYAGDTAISTASTSISFGVSAGTFDSGNIRIVGYR